MVNMLRSVLLKAMYPRTRGVPPQVQCPVIVLVMRESRRWLKNNDQVRKALKQDFPDHDIVEFWGDGPIIRQLKLFATAAIIVAPHGAGLSNMVVSSLHTPVLEIGPPDCSACYLHLALKLQHVYARHPGTKERRTSCASAYEPNVDEVIRLVRDLLEAKRQADAMDPQNASWHF
ncbi:unnamed protein product [Ectocarpus fasciculatus]